MDLAIVAGNGLSIAFSSELSLPKITERVIREFEKLTPDDSPALAAIRAIASRIEGEADEVEGDFEKLVGALETQAGLIHALEQLIDLAPADTEDLISALKRSADFAHRLYDIGAGIVLQDILDNSPGGYDATKHLHSFFNSIIEDFDGVVTFANLNYDSLVMSTLKTLDAPMSDMARGYQSHVVTVTNENDDGVVEELGEYEAYPLRSTLDFPKGPKYRIHLVHLHGSITFWRNRETGRNIKIPIEALREHRLLSDTENERRNFQPSVILANSRDKPDRVTEPPFSLGYSALSEGLQRSAHWLIVGYSFRDESVNSTLRSKFIRRADKPIVLVSTHGEELTRRTIEEALGWGAEDPSSKSWLLIDREGVEGLESRGEWNKFTDAS